LCQWQSNAVFFFSTFCFYRYIFVTEHQLLMLWSVKLCNNLTVINYYVKRAYKVVELPNSTCPTPRHWRDVSDQPNIRIIILEGFNPLNAELNPICHLLTLLEAHHILHVNRIRVKVQWQFVLDVKERHTVSSYWEQIESCS